MSHETFDYYNIESIARRVPGTGVRMATKVADVLTYYSQWRCDSGTTSHCPEAYIKFGIGMSSSQNIFQ